MEDIKDIKTLLQILLPIFLTWFGAFINKKWLDYKSKKFKLIDHPLFADLIYNVNEIRKWHPKTNRLVFIDALIIKMEFWNKEGYILAEELQKEKLSNIQLKNKIIKWASKVIDLYVSEWNKIGIPEKVINRINTQHQLKVDQFVNDIKEISFNDDMYPFQMQKSIAIFNVLRLLLTDTKNDFNQLIYRDKYNGEFTGIKYKGIPINDEEYNNFIKNKNNFYE